MREKVFLFGQSRSLVGVLTEPPSTTEDTKDRPGILLLNAGLLHRVGPNRLHVQLARRLAESGFVTLRFDFSSIGDSQAGGEAGSFLETAVSEARQAMDLLESSRGVRRFIVAGICSGADAAARTAGADPRVVGAVLIEGFGITLPGFFFYSRRRQLLSPRSWWRLVRGKSQTWSAIADTFSAGAEDDAEVVQRFDEPSGRHVLSELLGLGERGVRLLILYSTESAAFYSYRRLLHGKLARLRRRGLAKTAFLAGADHVFTLRHHQAELLSQIDDWVRSGFGSTADRASGTLGVVEGPAEAARLLSGTR